MAESEEQLRARLATIVGQLIEKNPGAVRQFQQLFGTDTTGSQWISYELQQSDVVTTIVAEVSAGKNHPSPRSIRQEVLLLVGVNRAGCLQFCQGALVTLTPFERRQFRPAHST